MSHRPLILLRIVQLILFIVDSGCTKHMTGNLKLLCNFVEKFLGTVHFGNDQLAINLGYGDSDSGECHDQRQLQQHSLTSERINHHILLMKDGISIHNMTGKPSINKSSHLWLHSAYIYRVGKSGTRLKEKGDPCVMDELHQFEGLKVGKLVDKPFGKDDYKAKDGRGYDVQESFAQVADLKQFGFSVALRSIQAKYALEILKKHNMDNCHSIGTPLATKPKLDVDLSGEPVDQSDYRSKIGSLMYLTSSRPDLVQAVCYCARYQARPTQKHLKEVKRIFKYLKGTINMGLWYPKDSGFELTAFSDADHAGCLDTRKSTSGGIQFLGDKLVSWMSKKQNCTAMSSAEAEYVALSASCAQVENGIIELYFVRTEYQLADMFTKALPEDRFKYLVRRIGMRCLTPADLEVLTNETA
ncbi:hypothetical protein Tco_0533651 [Tanacetum coccineum]